MKLASSPRPDPSPVPAVPASSAPASDQLQEDELESSEKSKANGRIAVSFHDDDKGILSGTSLGLGPNKIKST